METSSPTLPSDLIFEILSKASLKTLNTCKYVSKEWKHQIDELCARRTNNNNDYHRSGLFISQISYPCEIHNAYVQLNQSAVGTLSSIGSLTIPGDTTILASSKGILFCCTHDREGILRRYYVHKPTTRQWRELPALDQYWVYAAGMSVLGSKPLHFKIVILACRRHGWKNYGCFVFDSLLWEWRKIGNQVLASPCDLMNSEGVYIASNSSFHWLTKKDEIFALHEPTETIHKLSLPKPELEAHNRYSIKYPIGLVEVEGRLGLIRHKIYGPVSELWLLEGDDPIVGNNEVEWSKHVTIDLQKILTSRWILEDLVPVCFSDCGDCVVE